MKVNHEIHEEGLAGILPLGKNSQKHEKSLAMMGNTVRELLELQGMIA